MNSPTPPLTTGTPPSEVQQGATMFLITGATGNTGDTTTNSTDHKTMKHSILVTGAAGRLGGVGRTIVEILRERNLLVRALVRREDERSDALRAIGAEVVVGDLTRAGDVARALVGCHAYFSA